MMQFRLSTVFLFFVLASSCLTLGAWGVFTVVCIFFLVVVFRTCWASRNMRPFLVLLAATLASIVLPTAPGPFTDTREEARQGCCRSNLKQISWALLNYRDVHGQFPPVCSSNMHGGPMHSWRVLILPFIEEEALFQQYRFDEPWNSPHNQKIGKKVPPVYACVSATRDGRNSPPLTSYVAVTGARTGWQRTESTDSDSGGILLAEVANSDIHWMEPRDLDLDKQAALGENALRVAANHKLERKYSLEKETTGGNIACADSAAFCLPECTRLDEVAARLDVPYEERPAIDDLQGRSGWALFDWARCVALIVMLASSGAIAHRIWCAMQGDSGGKNADNHIDSPQ